MGNICNRLSHTYAPTYKVQTSLILCRKDLGYVCKIPWGGGYDHLAGSLLSRWTPHLIESNFDVRRVPWGDVRNKSLIKYKLTWVNGMTQKKIDRISSFGNRASVLKLSDRPSYKLLSNNQLRNNLVSTRHLRLWDCQAQAVCGLLDRTSIEHILCTNLA